MQKSNYSGPRRHAVRCVGPAPVPTTIGASLSFSFPSVQLQSVSFSLPPAQLQIAYKVEVKPLDQIAVADEVRAITELVTKYPRECAICFILFGAFLLCCADDAKAY
jgi:hypothetical protein